MRYLLSNQFKYELEGRLAYLYDVFHLFFSSHSADGFIQLEPIGSVNLSVLFIVGHNDTVYKYLKENKNKINESIIVVISCIDERFLRWFPSCSNIYATNTLNNKCTNRYNGNDFGFNFEITEAELKLFNSKESDIIQRICNSFFEIQLQQKGDTK